MPSKLPSARDPNAWNLGFMPDGIVLWGSGRRGTHLAVESTREFYQWISVCFWTRLFESYAAAWITVTVVQALEVALEAPDWQFGGAQSLPRT